MRNPRLNVRWSILGALSVSLPCAAAAQQFEAWKTREIPARKAPIEAVPKAPAAAATVLPVAPSLPVAQAPLVESLPATRLSEWPKLLPKSDGKLPKRWSEAEIVEAQKSCEVLLKGLDLVAVATTPVLEGSECGAAAPVELISVGKHPQVTFSPPVTVTCEMAAALHTWLTKDVQVSARKHLGSPIVRVDTMSSYSCRTAYGRAHQRLSEHGKANAIDIRAFMTAKADTADVLAGWGPTARDIQSQVAAAKAAEDKAKALAASRPASAPLPPAVQQVPSSAIADAPRLPSITVVPGGTALPSPIPSIGLSNGLPQPSRLGGPKPVEKLRGSSADGGPIVKAAKPAAKDAAPVTANLEGGPPKYSRFLREIHVSACRIFGTVLGPEANNAHRNHFHVDMAKRANMKNFCE